jgi:hypothetical protein
LAWLSLAGVLHVANLGADLHASISPRQGFISAAVWSGVPSLLPALKAKS